MKPKGWKNDPRWVMYEEDRQRRRQYRLFQLAQMRLEQTVAQLQRPEGVIDAVH